MGMVSLFCYDLLPDLVCRLCFQLGLACKQRHIQLLDLRSTVACYTRQLSRLENLLVTSDRGPSK